MPTKKLYNASLVGRSVVTKGGTDWSHYVPKSSLRWLLFVDKCAATGNVANIVVTAASKSYALLHAQAPDWKHRCDAEALTLCCQNSRATKTNSG